MKILIAMIIGLFIGAGIYSVWHTPLGGLIAVIVASAIPISVWKGQR